MNIIRSRVFCGLSFFAFFRRGYGAVTGKSVDCFSTVLLNATPTVILNAVKNLRLFSANLKVVLLIFIWMFLLSSTRFAKSHFCLDKSNQNRFFGCYEYMTRRMRKWTFSVACQYKLFCYSLSLPYIKKHTLCTTEKSVIPPRR